jgi:hypothetical protein
MEFNPFAACGIGTNDEKVAAFWHETVTRVSPAPVGPSVLAAGLQPGTVGRSGRVAMASIRRGAGLRALARSVVVPPEAGQRKKRQRRRQRIGLPALVTASIFFGRDDLFNVAEQPAGSAGTLGPKRAPALRLRCWLHQTACRTYVSRYRCLSTILTSDSVCPSPPERLCLCLGGV